MGKIDVSSYLTSEYEEFWAFLSIIAAKNKANLPSFGWKLEISLRDGRATKSEIRNSRMMKKSRFAFKASLFGGTSNLY